MERPKGRRTRRLLVEVVETVVLTVLIFIGVQAFVAQPFKVEGGSMETTLLPDEYVLVDKLTWRWAPYVRGDIVVLDPPDAADGADGADGDGTPFIKRVIGVAGDVVRLQDGVVYVDGEALDEPYLFAMDGVAEPTEAMPGGPTEWRVAEGQLIVLGEVAHVIGALPRSPVSRRHCGTARIDFGRHSRTMRFE